MAQQQPSKIPRCPEVMEAPGQAPIPVSRCDTSPPHPLPLAADSREGEGGALLPEPAKVAPTNEKSSGAGDAEKASASLPPSLVPEAPENSGHGAAVTPGESLLAAPAEPDPGEAQGPAGSGAAPPWQDGTSQRGSTGGAGQEEGPNSASTGVVSPDLAAEKKPLPAPGPAGAAAPAGGLDAPAGAEHRGEPEKGTDGAGKADPQTRPDAGEGPGASEGLAAVPGKEGADEHPSLSSSSLAEPQEQGSGADTPLLEQPGRAQQAEQLRESSSHGEPLDLSSSAHTEPFGPGSSDSEYPAGMLCTDSSSNETVLIVIEELGEGADAGVPGAAKIVYAKEDLGSEGHALACAGTGRDPKATAKAGPKQKRGKGKKRAAAPAVIVAGLSYTVYPHLPWVPPKFFSCFPRTCFTTIPSTTPASPAGGSKGSFKISQRVLLGDVSFEVQPRQILAIAGSSGSGKSVLLDVVAGRTRPGCQSGSVLVRGMKAGSRALKRTVAYAAQEEALLPVLTPRETLLLSASLRLGPSVAPAAKARRVQKLLADLDLDAVADVRIGAGPQRGLLQGQRRRVSIGTELVHNPVVVLLDEPTSGLDSHAALQVVEVLRRMATKRKRTIILTLNQASVRILDLVDSVLLLAQGAVLHHGTVPDLEQRLELGGMPVPARMNAVEYAIELLKTQPHSIKAFMYNGVLDLEANSDNASMWTLASPGSPPAFTPMTTSASSKAMSAYPYSNVSRSTTATSLCRKDGGRKAWSWSGRTAKQVKSMQQNSVFMEVGTLCSRNVKVLWRSPGFTLVRMLQMLLCGLCLGTLFLNIQKDAQGVQGLSFVLDGAILCWMQERMGFFAFSLAALLSSSVEAIPLFIQERQVFLREQSSGAYRVTSYLLASVLVFLPFHLVLAVIFSASSYWLIGLNPTVFAFLFFVLTMWTVLLAGHSIAACVVVVAPSYNAATALVWGLLGAFFLFSGYFIAKQSIPDYWVWMNYISVFKYPLDALLLNEYGGANASASFGAVTGGQLLDAIGLSSTSRWVQLGILAGMTVGYQTLRFLALTWHKSMRH